MALPNLCSAEEPGRYRSLYRIGRTHLQTAITAPEEAASLQFTVVTNWAAEAKK